MQSREETTRRLQFGISLVSSSRLFGGVFGLRDMIEIGTRGLSLANLE
jgi:hypothetical protein